MKKSKIKKKLIAICSFLIIAMLCFSLRIKDLLNLPQFFLLLFGTILFYFAGNGFQKEAQKEFQKTEIQVEEIGRCALLVGFLEAMVLILAVLQEGNLDSPNQAIVQGVRPIFYGFCIWMVCASTKEDTNQNQKPEKKTIEDYYLIFQEKGLSRRETEVAILALQGRSNAEIGYELNIAESTVKKHMSNIFEKLKIENREELRKIK